MRFRKFLKPYKTRGSSFREHTEIKRRQLSQLQEKVTIGGVKSSFNFEIKPQNIKKVSVKGTSKVLNLTYAKHALLKDHDYTIGETVNAGKKVNITIIGHGDFQGSVVKKVKE